MDFEPTDDRRMLADTLDRWLARACPIARRNAVAYAPPFHDPALWSELAGLGILHALVPEASGGYGGAGFDVATVFERLGRALCPEPVLPALLAARVLMAAGADLAPLLSGERRLALAMDEPEAPWEAGATAAHAEPDGDGWRLTGRKAVVYGGPAADAVLVVARHGEGVAAFEVAAADAGRADHGLIDGGGASDLFLDAAPARLLLADAGGAVEDALDWGRLALCAEAVGAMDVARDTMLEHMRTRRQFGRAIGTFQALRHRAVDVAMQVEQARSLSILAAARMGTPAQARTVSMAKSLVGRVAQRVADESVQMQGGIAMTWEHPASHYAKRLTMIDAQLGDCDVHLARVMAGSGAG